MVWHIVGSVMGSMDKYPNYCIHNKWALYKLCNNNRANLGKLVLEPLAVRWLLVQSHGHYLEQLEVYESSAVEHRSQALTFSYHEHYQHSRRIRIYTVWIILNSTHPWNWSASFTHWVINWSVIGSFELGKWTVSSKSITRVVLANSAATTCYHSNIIIHQHTGVITTYKLISYHLYAYGF